MLVHIRALTEKKVIDARHFVAAAQQPRNEIRCNETGRAGNQDLQTKPSSAARVFASSSGVPMS
jgi:hypothetical protein